MKVCKVQFKKSWNWTKHQKTERRHLIPHWKNCSSLYGISFWKPAYVSERAPFFSVLSAGGDVLIRANLQWRERVEWPQRTHFLIECMRSAGLNTPLINCPIKLIWALNHVYMSLCFLQTTQKTWTYRLCGHWLREKSLFLLLWQKLCLIYSVIL